MTLRRMPPIGNRPPVPGSPLPPRPSSDPGVPSVAPLARIPRRDTGPGGTRTGRQPARQLALTAIMAVADTLLSGRRHARNMKKIANLR